MGWPKGGSKWKKCTPKDQTTQFDAFILGGTTKCTGEYGGICKGNPPPSAGVYLLQQEPRFGTSYWNNKLTAPENPYYQISAKSGWARPIRGPIPKKVAVNHEDLADQPKGVFMYLHDKEGKEKWRLFEGDAAQHIYDYFITKGKSDHTDVTVITNTQKRNIKVTIYKGQPAAAKLINGGNCHDKTMFTTGYYQISPDNGYHRPVFYVGS